MFTIISSDQVDTYKAGNGPMANYLRYRDRAAALETIKDGSALIQPESAEALITYFAPFYDATLAVGPRLSLLWAEVGKYFSFQRRNHVTDTGVSTYVATKPVDPYVNVAVSYTPSSLEPSKLQGKIVTVETTTNAQTQTLVALDLTRANCPTPTFTIYDQLEEAIYPGTVFNVDQIQFASKLQALMLAAGWEASAYTANPWTSEDAAAQFMTQLQAAVTAGSVPNWYKVPEALGGLSTSSSVPVYVEGHTADGQNVDWYYFSPNFNANGPQIFFGRVGLETVYLAFMPSATLLKRPNPSSGLATAPHPLSTVSGASRCFRRGQPA